MKRIKSFRQLGHLMRIHLLILSLVIGNEGTAAPGNGEDVLNRKISITVEKKEVRTILSEISKLAEIKFVYSAQRIPCRKKVSLQAEDERLRDVLNSLLAPLDVLYYVSGNQIVLTKKAEDELFKLELRTVSDDKKETPQGPVSKPITGKITNDKGDPLEGVSVTIKGTTRGTTTNSAGVFTIDAEVGETLEFSMVGFQQYSLQVGTSNSVAVQLLPSISSINEVIVVGYGTQKRANVTGAISNVTSKTVAELPVPNISQALQGRVAGLQVTNNGSPGTQPIVRIRGISSISFASDPLYVID
jgi:TonB-dependent starch-binding outer membrane protein SusC